jgi:hypothetical protein
MARQRAITIIGNSFGDADLRIVIGVRDLGRTVPAMWQEAVKNRSTLTFADYVDGIRDRADNGVRFWRQQNAGVIADRWAEHLGPERVHVITLPPPDAPGEVLWERFSGVAGIRAEPSWDEAPRTNESLGAASALVMRRLNELTHDLSVQAYKRRVKAVGKHLLPVRRAEEDRVGFTVPGWLKDESSRIREHIAASGVHVVGDLQELTPVDVPGVDPQDVSATAQLDAALFALDGSLRQVQRIRPD